MMQNGFRRIALAQGLLPERLPSREVSANVESSGGSRLDLADTPRTPSDAWDNGVEMRVASPRIASIHAR
jgi:hypothetical protein